MPVNKLFFTFFVIGFLSMALTKLMPHADRSIARIGFASVPQSQYTSRGVIDGAITVNLFTRNLTADTQEITAETSTQFDYDNELKFKWTLGENVKIVTGDLIGQSSHFKSNERKSFSIVVTGFTAIENHHVGFEITGRANSTVIHGHSLIASQMDQTFENIVQNVERIKKEQEQQMDADRE